MNGEYDHSLYVSAYNDAFGLAPKGGRLVDFSTFYQVFLTYDQYDEKTENKFFEYLLNHKEGIYYIYGDRLTALPECFASKQASHYIGAVELLALYEYGKNKGRLQFVVDWLESNKNENGMWDMSSAVNDKVYFPLSDSWRKKNDREMDCTYRIQKLIDALHKVV